MEYSHYELWDQNAARLIKQSESFYDLLFENLPLPGLLSKAKDLLLVFQIRAQVDKDLGESDNPNSSRNISTFKKLVADFNKKYSGLKLAFDTSGYDAKIRMSCTVPEEKLVKYVSMIRDFTSYDQKTKEAMFESRNTLSFRFGEKTDIIYLASDMLDPGSPEFKLCVYLMQASSPIDLSRYAADFSFDIAGDSPQEGEGHSLSSNDYKTRF
ncbi:MAG: hypothetical protein HGA85_08775 [Nanoarchaeota archaeon]|nr:hypothetical protein [Nanoarchaeota archaeon]